MCRVSPPMTAFRRAGALSGRSLFAGGAEFNLGAMGREGVGGKCVFRAHGPRPRPSATAGGGAALEEAKKQRKSEKKCRKKRKGPADSSPSALRAARTGGALLERGRAARRSAHSA